jgi:hypothetical protein
VALLVVIGICAVAIVRITELERLGSPIGEPELTPALSPNGDGQRDRLTLRLNVRERQRITVRILDSNTHEVTTLALRKRSKGPVTLHWDGRDEDGTRAKEGIYRVDVRLEKTGRAITLPQHVKLDVHAPSIRSASALLVRDADVVRTTMSIRGASNAFLECDGLEMDRLRFVRGSNAGSSQHNEHALLSVRAPHALKVGAPCTLRVRDTAWNTTTRHLRLKRAPTGTGG